MANIPEDYPISRKAAWRVVMAGVSLAAKREDWNAAGAIMAICEMILDLPEWDEDSEENA